MGLEATVYSDAVSEQGLFPWCCAIAKGTVFPSVLSDCVYYTTSITITLELLRKSESGAYSRSTESKSDSRWPGD